MYLTDLATVLRRGGVPVVEVAGWQRRGHGGLSGVKTIVCHHTGGLHDLDVIVNGRPGLDGPLANVWLARTGEWFVAAAGLTYNAGEVRDPSYANEWDIGIEAEATGVDAWPAIQYDSFALGCKVLADRYLGGRYGRVLGHKEVCAPVGRKSDPNFDMTVFRARVAGSIPQEADVQLTEKIHFGPGNTEIVGAATLTVEQALAMAASKSLETDRRVVLALGRLAALESALAEQGSVIAEILAAVKPPVA
jgi:hypothetical protein